MSTRIDEDPVEWGINWPLIIIVLITAFIFYYCFPALIVLGWDH